MPKFTKILIPGFLTVVIIAVFGVFYISNTKDKRNIIFADEMAVSNGESVYICPEATNLEEINPLCPKIIILKLGETINGLTLTTTEYEGMEYYVVLGFENGGGGEFGTVQKSIKGINDYIQSLPNSAFKNNPQQKKNTLQNKLEEVFIKIENKEYQDAINKLQNDIRAKADGSIDGKSNNDWITNTDSQKIICEIIDDLLIYLKSL